MNLCNKKMKKCTLVWAAFAATKIQMQYSEVQLFRLEILEKYLLK